MPERWQTTSQGSVTRAELDTVARELLAKSDNRTIWLFYGEMGSGKTTLIKAIARQLGVTETMSSPTFSIVNEYELSADRKVYHIDLYRLANERELSDIGMDEYLNSGQYCFIEWPEKLGAFTPTRYVEVRLSTIDEHHRHIEYSVA
jgi:tRNA threonylcarbamoyladenosine biosynthesis protein TsaE